MEGGDQSKPQRRDVPYSKSYNRLSKEGIVGHICVCLAWWDTGRHPHEPYRGNQNDVQLILNRLVREYHKMNRPDHKSLPSTERGFRALQEGTGYVREHAIPVACVVWALFNEVQLMAPIEAIQTVQRVLDDTRLEAIIHIDEDKMLKPFHCTMPKWAHKYESWVGEAVWARYTECRVDRPVMRDDQGRPL